MPTKRCALKSSACIGFTWLSVLVCACSGSSADSVDNSTATADDGGSDVDTAPLFQTDFDTDSHTEGDTALNTDPETDTNADTNTGDGSGAVITASGENPDAGETKEMAFDGDETTEWLTFKNTGWIQYDFAGDASKTVSGYSITSANDFPGRDPKDWSLKGSNDGKKWKTLDQRKNECFSSRFQKRLFKVDNDTSYKMYRLEVSAIRDPAEDTLQIAEIELLEDGSGGIEPGTEGNCTDTWKFVVVGESLDSAHGVNADVWSHLVYAIIAEGAELVLFTGNLTDSGSQAELEQWIEIAQPLYNMNIGVYPVRGNHDVGEAAWNTVFSGEYQLPQNGPKNEKNLTYSGRHKNLFFVGLDNYSDREQVNQPWLDDRLKKNTQPHVIVFGHQPAFAANNPHTLDDHARERDIFWKSLQDAGARAYFCGRDHFYDHAKIQDRDKDPTNDIHQFIVGTAGGAFDDFDGDYAGNNGEYTPMQQYFSAHYGYVLVEISGPDVQMTFKERRDNSYWAADSFSYSVE